MSWEKYKTQFENKYPDEVYFILGIDLGNKTSTIAYYDVIRKQPEIIDISGGYGKPSYPTVAQYVEESKEWIFGEYALLNPEGSNIKIESLVEDLGKNKYYNAGDKPVSLVNVLSLYLKNLISSCNDLNPRAEIAGIVISVPNYIGINELDEIKRAVRNSDIEKLLIEYSESRRCILARYFFDNEIVDKEKILILDFGSTELRAGIYKVNKKDNAVLIDCLSSLNSPELGESNVEELVFNMFAQKIKEEKNIELEDLTSFEKEQLHVFSYHNKDLLFQKNISKKSIKLYYNFLHPPIQHTISNEDIDKLVGGFFIEFKNFIIKTFKKISNEDENINIENIDKVICVGGGFESIWAKETCKNIFDEKKIIKYKNAKTVTAEGATVISASRMGLIKDISFDIIDENILEKDIGIKIFKNNQERFFPFIERNSFWWQNDVDSLFIINENVENSFNLDIYERDEKGDTAFLKTLVLDDIPKRPIGTSKFKINLKFKNSDVLEAEVWDFGFGELFPKTDYNKKFIIQLNNKKMKVM